MNISNDKLIKYIRKVLKNPKKVEKLPKEIKEEIEDIFHFTVNVYLTPINNKTHEEICDSFNGEYYSTTTNIDSLVLSAYSQEGLIKKINKHFKKHIKCFTLTQKDINTDGYFEFNIANYTDKGIKYMEQDLIVQYPNLKEDGIYFRADAQVQCTSDIFDYYWNWNDFETILKKVDELYN